MTPSNESGFVYESGEPIDIGEHGEHDFVFQGGVPVTDEEVSDLVFESGTGLGSSALIDPGFGYLIVRLDAEGTETTDPEWGSDVGPEGQRWVPDYGPVDGPDPVWVNERYVHGMLAGDGVIVTGGSSGVLFGHDAETGERLWRAAPQDGREGFYIAAAVIAESDGLLYAFAQRGSSNTPDRFDNPPARLVAIDLGTGEPVMRGPLFGWHRPAGAFRSNLSHTEGVVLCVNGRDTPDSGRYVDGVLQALDGETGELLWSDSTIADVTIDGISYTLIPQTDVAPEVSDGKIYSPIRYAPPRTYLSSQHGHAQIDAHTKEIDWYTSMEWPLGSRLVLYHNGSVYATVYGRVNNSLTRACLRIPDCQSPDIGRRHCCTIRQTDS